MMETTGKLEITEAGIIYTVNKGSCSCSSGLPCELVTVEMLMRFAEDFARSMQLPYEDFAKERQRIAKRDQLEAFARESVAKAAQEIDERAS